MVAIALVIGLALVVLGIVRFAQSDRDILDAPGAQAPSEGLVPAPGSVSPSSGGTEQQPTYGTRPGSGDVPGSGKGG